LDKNILVDAFNCVLKINELIKRRMNEMYEAKTKLTDVNVLEFLNQIPIKKRKADAFKLLEIYEKVTGYPGVLWGAGL